MHRDWLPEFWMTLPFIGLLLSIALAPLVAGRFWSSLKNQAAIAFLFSLPVLLLCCLHAPHLLVENLGSYVSFVILLASLFIVSGGIWLAGGLQSTPAANTLLLAAGAVLCNFIGTTGASMVLIRPLLRANLHRKHHAHLPVFFIFLVSNIGGLLTPLGDPPLFLGFLHQVPFFWVTKAILPHMLFTTAILLAIFYILDSYYFLREKRQEIIVELDKEQKVKFKLEGGYNLILLAGVVGMVVTSGCWDAGTCDIRGMEFQWQNLARDVGIVVLGLISLAITPQHLRKANDFSWFPIIEVAKLFAGIFVTIIPVLAILKAGLDGPWAGLIALIKEPLHYYWISGALSSFLDNAPTYLTFFNLALGQLGLSEEMIPGALAAHAVTANPAFISFLKAVSVGSVFMGANTYIGNAPNFMVNSIAKEFGVNMPSFFGYMFKYSIPILIPIFIVVGLVFF